MALDIGPRHLFPDVSRACIMPCVCPCVRCVVWCGVVLCVSLPPNEEHSPSSPQQLDWRASESARLTPSPSSHHHYRCDHESVVVHGSSTEQGQKEEGITKLFPRHQVEELNKPSVPKAKTTMTTVK